MSKNAIIKDFFGKKVIVPSKSKIVQVTHSLYFDGGSRGNPGPSGAGYVIYKDHLELLYGDYPNGIGTNNEAEYRGIIEGMKAAVEHNITNINIYGDSLLVINQILGKWKCKAKNLMPLLIEARDLVRKFERITIQHIPREKNTRADELSNVAMDTVEKNLIKEKYPDINMSASAV